METDTRITAIRRAKSMGQLHRAMEGFYADAVRAHAELGAFPHFRRYLEDRLYSRALIDLAVSANAKGIEQIAACEYPDVERILMAAIERELEIR